MPKTWLLCLRNFWFTEICFTSKRTGNVRTQVQASIIGTRKEKRFTQVSEEEGGKRKIKKGFMKAWHVTISRVFIYLFFKLTFLKNVFNWRLITLQYCSGFAIHWHESAMGVQVSPILNPPPTSLPIPSLRVIPVSCIEPWVHPIPECPVSCIEPGLAIYVTYDHIHVSMLFAQIIPPSPSPTESKRLFYTSVSLLPSHI